MGFREDRAEAVEQVALIEHFLQDLFLGQTADATQGFKFRQSFAHVQTCDQRLDQRIIGELMADLRVFQDATSQFEQLDDALRQQLESFCPFEQFLTQCL